MLGTARAVTAPTSGNISPGQAVTGDQSGHPLLPDRTGGCSQQAPGARPVDELGPVAHPELAHGGPQVVLDGALAYVELAGDPQVGGALGDQPDDFELAVGKQSARRPGLA